MEKTSLHLLPKLLLPWYDTFKRDLPWRKDQEPYHIWISEIMLQQTRVEAVKGYYIRFLQALPSVQELAACDDDTLHKLWEGLGYYSRVRNLKKAAQEIVNNYGGSFPTDYAQILALPGIGEYTAGAICSIAFNQPVPAVDGNVLRIWARLMNDSRPIDDPEVKKEVRNTLKTFYPSEAGRFTQALMELGATICGPNRQPDCDNCPCKGVCIANQCGSANDLPVKHPKKDKRTEDRTVLIFSCDAKYALDRRPEKGLLAGLWEFPNLKGKLEVDEALSHAEAIGLIPVNVYRQVERKHIFTHIQWNLRGFYIEVKETGSNLEWFTADSIRRQTALPTAFRQFWEEIDHV